ncbi:L,D-transpeptidase [Phreatobacter sp.]|uniref:L,D-transpeptidase n=1 Tax=Phreatobacter sp. TaxID=1966341 RepID=UPI003F7238D9
MTCLRITALAAALLVAAPLVATDAAAQVASARRGDLGGGFIEFLFEGGQPPAGARSGAIAGARPAGQAAGRPARQHDPLVIPAEPRRGPVLSAYEPVRSPLPQGEPRRMAGPASTPARGIDPRFLPQVVQYQTTHRPGTVIIDTRQRYLYLVQADGMARRYGVGIGRPGFGWSGTKTVTRKAEWPDWRPPAEMLRRRPDLPRFMAGGPDNPLGARALYLGSSLYRIHGSNEPWTIGQAVSSGCFRMRNEDVIDLYSRVRVGTRVVVM